MPRLIIQKGDFVVNNISVPEDVLAFTIGSEQGNDVIIDDEKVSYYHIQFERQGNAYYVRDLQSQTGTFVNGSKISGRTIIRNKDQIKIGGHKIIFQHIAVDHESSLSLDRREGEYVPSGPKFEDKIAGVPSLSQLNSWLNEEHEEKDIFLEDRHNGDHQSDDRFDDPLKSYNDIFDDNQDNEIGSLTRFITSEEGEDEKTALALETEGFLKPEKTDANELDLTDANLIVAEKEGKEKDATLHFYLLGIYGYYLGKKFKLKQPRTRIGRERKRNHIRLTRNSNRRRERGVSRRHATISFKNNKYYLRDKNSKSGTWVNQEKVGAKKEIRLRPGDEIEIATDRRNHIFRFVMEGDWDFSIPKRAGIWHVRYRGLINAICSTLTVLAGVFLLLSAHRTKNALEERPDPLSATETFWATGSIDTNVINDTRPAFASFPAIADLNGDNLMDVVIVDRRGMLRCIDGATKGALWINPQVETDYDIPITLADLNNDQNPDVIVQSKDSRVRILDGRNGRQILKSPVFDGPLTGAPVVADFNGDGLQDLAVSSKNKSIYIGFSGVQKSTWVIIETDEPINGFASAEDVTSNGIPDILIGTESGQVIIVDGSIPKIIAKVDVGEELNKATGTFNNDAQIRFPVGFGDLNGDKKNDLIVSTVHGNLITLNGESFERFWLDETDSTMRAGHIEQTISLGDFDGDGLVDVANLTCGGRLRVISGKDVGKDRKLVLWEYPNGKPGNLIGPPAVADFNKNGTMDIVVVDRDSCLYIFEGLTGQILWENTKKGPATISPPLIGDLDNDNYLDILRYRADGNFYKISTNSLTFKKALFWGQTFGNSRHTNTSSFSKPNVSNYSMLMVSSVLMILGTFGLNMFWRKRRWNLSKAPGVT